MAHGRSDALQSGDRTPGMPNVVIVTAIPADPCQFPTADLINKLSVINKQDYARLHGFELHVSSDVIDPSVTAVRARHLVGQHECSRLQKAKSACRTQCCCPCSRVQQRTCLAPMHSHPLIYTRLIGIADYSCTGQLEQGDHDPPDTARDATVGGGVDPVGRRRHPLHRHDRGAALRPVRRRRPGRLGRQGQTHGGRPQRRCRDCHSQASILLASTRHSGDSAVCNAGSSWPDEKVCSYASHVRCRVHGIALIARTAVTVHTASLRSARACKAVLAVVQIGAAGS